MSMNTSPARSSAPRNFEARGGVEVELHRVGHGDRGFKRFNPGFDDEGNFNMIYRMQDGPPSDVNVGL
jgi:hypothetical protein